MIEEQTVYVTIALVAAWALIAYFAVGFLTLAFFCYRWGTKDADPRTMLFIVFHWRDAWRIHRKSVAEEQTMLRAAFVEVEAHRSVLPRMRKDY